MDRQRVIEKLNDIEFKGGNKVYRIIRELGRGGNGVAFLCQDAKKQNVVAKVYLPPDTRDLDEKALERFDNEVALTARLKHPNIVTSLGSGAVNVGAYIRTKKDWQLCGSSKIPFGKRRFKPSLPECKATKLCSKKLDSYSNSSAQK